MAKPKRYKKLIKARRKDATKVSIAAGESVDRHLIGRLQNLGHSWRFVFGWMLLILLMTWVLALQTRALSSFYTRDVPKEGGVYVEGITGPLTNMSPIYATSSADRAVSSLLFNSLLKYDTNNQLVGDLALSIEPNDKASLFDIKLRQDVYWHDGRLMTADDVVFTIKTIQNPDAQTPLLSSWQGVVVEKTGEHSVSFKLPGSYSPFPSLLTFGVLPKHILEDVAPKNLRSHEFNTRSPVGSGPFRFQRITSTTDPTRDNEIQVKLLANSEYFLGAPKLESFTFWVADSRDRLSELFVSGELNGAYELNGKYPGLAELDSQRTTFKDTSAVFAFYKTTNPLLSDKSVRLALAKAIDVPLALGRLDSPVSRINGPLLKEQLGYSNPAAIKHDPVAAAAELDALGWTMGVDGKRQKDGQPISLAITSQRGSGYEPIVEAMIESLADVGVTAVSDYREQATFTDTVLQDHSYNDILVYGINNGTDPDVYSFWHSSQASENSTIRLNLSEYKSTAVDEALEAGRSRVDPGIRAQKYEDFQQTWLQDLPAMPLYRPSFVYYTQNGVVGPKGSILSLPVDRFRDVHMWTVLEDKAPIN